jgi:hypothetical protein
MNLAYWKKLGERAVVVFASSLGSMLSAGQFDLINAPWQASLATAGMAAFLAVLASIGGGAATTSDSPTLTSKETEENVQ